MHPLSIFIIVAALLLPDAAARSFDDDFFFQPPPLMNAFLYFSAIFLLATFTQLVIAVYYLFRARSGHRIPGIGVILALVILTVEFTLNIALVVGEWTINDFGDTNVSFQTTFHIDAAASFFWDWVDLMLFAVVVLVFRDRYLTYVNAKETPAFSLVHFMMASTILFVVMVALVITNVALSAAAENWFYKNSDILTTGESDNLNDILINIYKARVRVADDVYFTFIAVEFIAALFLIAFAVEVKRLVRTDRITNITLIIVTPLVTLLAISRIILAIVKGISIDNGSYNRTVHAFDFATVFVFGVLPLTALSILVRLLVRPEMWDVTRAGTGTGPSGGDATQHGASKPQYDPGAHLVDQPQASSPGQQGYTEHPQDEKPPNEA